MLTIAFIVFVAFAVFGALPIRAQTGLASKYGNEHGQYRRADGKRYNPWQIGCAYRGKKLGSTVRVTNLATGKSIACVVNDRPGPGVSHGRIIDLSFGAARALGMRGGLLRVRVE